jgi:hypothetical protein
MSIVDPNGKTLQADREIVTYEVGAVKLTTNALPGDKLQEALAGARQMAGMQLMAAAKQQAAQGGIHIPEESLRVQVTAEASKIEDPFKMEPAAQAVFMMLANEIRIRTEIIQDLTKRIEQLECKPKTDSSSEDGLQN